MFFRCVISVFVKLMRGELFGLCFSVVLLPLFLLFRFLLKSIFFRVVGKHFLVVVFVFVFKTNSSS